MQLLVTGGAGFIGSHFVRSLLTGFWPDLVDAQVRVLDLFTYAGNRENLAAHLADPRLSIITGDICDPDTVDQAMSGVDVVVHFAAESHVDRSITGATDFVRTNVLGTQVLLESARRHRVGRFVHISTDEVYGSISSGSWSEDHPLQPNSPYSASKAGAELLARSYAHTYGLDVVITRCSNNYGPYQHPEKLIPLFITNLFDGKRVPLYGDGGNVRDWLHVSDHCRGIELVMRSGKSGEAYNIGSGTELTNKELTLRLLDACGRGPELIDRVPDRLGHDLRYSVDDSRIRSELGYEPSVEFDAGLAQTIEWYRDNRSWWQPLKDRA